MARLRLLLSGVWWRDAEAHALSLLPHQVKAVGLSYAQGSSGHGWLFSGSPEPQHRAWGPGELPLPMGALWGERKKNVNLVIAYSYDRRHESKPYQTGPLYSLTFKSHINMQLWITFTCLFCLWWFTHLSWQSAQICKTFNAITAALKRFFYFILVCWKWMFQSVIACDNQIYITCAMNRD